MEVGVALMMDLLSVMKYLEDELIDLKMSLEEDEEELCLSQF